MQREKRSSGWVIKSDNLFFGIKRQVGRKYHNFIFLVVVFEINTYWYIHDFTSIWSTCLRACLSFFLFPSVVETFQPTAFGKAALGSGLPPELCIGIRSDIARARQSFVLTTELHLAYLCVPVTEDKNINYQWQRFELLLKNLSPSEKIVADKVGINMNYVFQKSRSYNSFIGAGTTNGGTSSSNNNFSTKSASQVQQQDSNAASQQQQQQQQQLREELAAAMSEQDRICQRFGTALLLSDTLQEMSTEDIRAKYGLDRAVVLGLRDRACRFAGMLAVFCERLGWHDVELLVSKFQARVLYGVRPEVLCLMEIDHVQAATARMLYKAGLRTPEAVAAVPDVQRVIAALAAGRGGAEKLNEAEKAAIVQQARRIIRNAKSLLENRAKKLKEDAAEALQLVESMNQGVADISLGGHDGAGFVENGGGNIEAVEKSLVVAPVQNYHQQQQQQQDGGGRAEQALLVVPPLPSPAITNSSDAITTGTTIETTTSSLPTAAPTSLPPDLWEFGCTSGLTILGTAAHVLALKKVLIEGKYTRFAFQFDITMQQQGDTTSASINSSTISCCLCSSRGGCGSW
jgi:hypothetical protein